MPTTCDPSDATLAILAGGEGSRMGRPKGLLRIGQQPILEYLHDRFAWPGPTCIVTAPGRENPPGAKLFGQELVDPEAGLGPLRGILTALEGLGTAFLMVAPVDMPLLKSAHLRHLLDTLAGRLEVLGLMYDRSADSNDRIEPFPLALRCEALEVIRSKVNAGKSSVRHLLQDACFGTILAPPAWPANIWTNLNDPRDFEFFNSR